MPTDTTELALESRTAPSNPLDAVPAELPFDVPNGPPISLERAHAATKRLVNSSLPPDVELGAASLGQPAAQDGIKAPVAHGLHKPRAVEDRLGYYLSKIHGQAGAPRGFQLHRSF